MPAKTKFELKLGAATREAFGKALVELGRENKDVVVCDADLSKSTYDHRISPKSFPTASSNAASPKPTWWRSARAWPWRARFRSSSSFSCFVMNKGFEQLRVTAAYPQRQSEGGRARTAASPSAKTARRR